jgi:hypothetical protein
MPRHKDDLWRAEDYDDEPRSRGNFGHDPFRQMCVAEEEKRNRVTLEEAFSKAEAKAQFEGLTPSEDYVATKKLVLSGVVTLDQAIMGLKARYANEPPRVERSTSGLPLFPSTGKAITSEMVKEAEEECDLIDANPEAFYKQQLEVSCRQATQESTSDALLDVLRLGVGSPHDYA